MDIASFNTEDYVGLCYDMAVASDGKALVLLRKHRVEVWRLMNGSKHFHTAFGLPDLADASYCDPCLELGVFGDENVVFIDHEGIPSKTRPRLIAVNAFAESPRYKRIATAPCDGEPIIYESPRDCPYDFVFCVSKRYGLFYSSNGTLYQSQLANDKEHVWIKTMLPQPIAWVNKMLFDESYGISGRLLIFYGRSGDDDQKQEVDQMLNLSEFPCFFDESLTPSHSVIVFSVFGMLFGDDVAEQLLKRRMELLTQMSHEPKSYRLGKGNMWFITGKHCKG